MVQTFGDGKNIYSVDMMFAYINLFKPKSKSLKIKDLEHMLHQNTWRNPSGLQITPIKVLENPQKYKDHMRRIKKADLKYPIIIYDKFVIDGVHRLTKAYLEKKKIIKATVFTKDLLQKFKIAKYGDWLKVDKLQIHDYIQMFYKKFC